MTTPSGFGPPALRRATPAAPRFGRPIHYLATVGIILIAAAIRLGLNLIVPGTLPVAPFYVAVLLPALLWGAGPAMLAVALVVPLGWYLFIGPANSFALPTPNLVVGVIVYFLVASTIAWLGARYHRMAALNAAREADLAAANRRFEDTLAAADVGTWDLDLGTDRVEASASTVALFGLAPGEVHPLATYVAAVDPADREMMLGETRRAAERRSAIRLEYRLASTAGGVRWLAARGRTILDHAGRERMLGAIFDITDRKAVEEQLRLSETRLRRMIEAAPHPMVLHADDGDIQALSASWLEQGAYAREAVSSFKAWVGLAFAGDAPAVQRAVDGAFERGEVVHLGAREILGGDAERRVWDITVVPLEDRLGRRRWAVTACVDVTEQVEGSRANQLLLRELAHRVKNTLAIVVAIANQTLGKGAVPPEAYEAFSGRLNALAATHDLLVGSDWTGAELGAILATELEPFTAEPDRTTTPPKTPRRPDRVTLEGPSVPLRPQTALNLGLVLHELVTNAAKYGALSVPQGRLLVRWRVLDGEGGERTAAVSEQGPGDAGVEQGRSEGVRAEGGTGQAGGDQVGTGQEIAGPGAMRASAAEARPSAEAGAKAPAPAAPAGDKPTPPRLEIEWRECDGPEVVKPTRGGFGTRLLARSIKALGGETTFDFPPEGFICHLSLPIPDEPQRTPKRPVRVWEPRRG